MSERRKHLARRGYGPGGMSIRCACGNYPSVDGTVRQQEDAHRAHRVEMGETVKPRTPTRLERTESRVAELEAQLERYVGKEPTVADEMAYLRRCLNAVYEVCDQAEKQATRWEQPLPVPEWVDVVRQAADGERPESPDDRRRRIYIDGEGKGWLDQSTGRNGFRWVAPLAIFPGDSEPATKVTERTGGLHEIGRCW